MTGATADRPLPMTCLEAALRSDWMSVVVLLVALPVISWGWIVAMARDMYGPMTGASHWMMTTTWDATHLGLLWAMWAVMMTAMMLPSAAPMLLIYGAVVRRSEAPRRAAALVHALAAGYLATWGVFSVGAVATQRALSSTWLLSPMMELSSRWVGGALLLVAGLYQWTPLKQACLNACQSPASFMAGHWTKGVRGAFQLGIAHGRSCVGCCWALMLVLFVGGVMRLSVIVALTAFVAVERLGLLGRFGPRLSGAGLIGVGSWMLLR